MKVITKYPVYESADGSVIVNTILDGYSGIDASSSFQDILNFQSWVNKWKGTNLVVDGIYGSKSKAAYAKYGQEFEKSKAIPYYVPKKETQQATKKNTDKVKETTQTNDTKKTEEAKPSPSSKTSKLKLSKTTKIALAISAVVLAVVVIRIVQKSVKK
jgi:hypothetical protein